MINASAFSRTARAAAFSILLAACGGDARAAGPVVRDSAGVRIVQNDAPTWKKGQEWRVEDEPALEIGVVEGEGAYQLDDVRGVVRLSDGRIVVADGGSHELRFFSAEGRHLSSAGRKGGGPGEFEDIAWMGVGRGDSLIVWDPKGARVSVLASDGRFFRVFKPAGLHLFPSVEALVGGGGLLMTPGFDPDQMDTRPEGEYRDTAVWLHVPLAGGEPREISRRPAIEMFFSKSEDLFLTEPVVFGRALHVAGARDGYYAGASDEYQVEHRGTDGALRRLIRRAHEPRRVTDAHVDGYFAGPGGMDLSEVPPSMRAKFQEQQRTQRARIPRRATLPSFAQLLVDGNENLWVRDPRPREEEAHNWSVFDAEGRWLGSVRTPAELTVHQIGADWILGTAKDELDVEHVRVHRILKPAP